MLPKKFVRRSGEKEAKTSVHRGTKEAVHQLGPLKPLLNLPIGRIDLQIQRLDKISTDLSINFEAANEDARKILKEAAAVAEQKKALTKIPNTWKKSK